jgi:hypothetical protein
MNLQANKGPTVNASVQCTAPNPAGRGYCGTVLLPSGQCPRCGAVKNPRRRPGSVQSMGARRSLSANQCDNPGCGTVLLEDGTCPRCYPVAERPPEERRDIAHAMKDKQLIERIEVEDGYEDEIDDDDSDPTLEQRPRRVPPAAAAAATGDAARIQAYIANEVQQRTDAAVNRIRAEMGAEFTAALAAAKAELAPAPASTGGQQPAEPVPVPPGKPASRK